MKAKFAAIQSIVILSLAVFLCLLVGRAVHAFVGGLPASIYGMALFACALQSGLLPERQIQWAAERALKHLTLVFVPVALGIMRYGELLLSAGWKILIVASLTTVVGMVCIGAIAQKLLPHDDLT